MFGSGDLVAHHHCCPDLGNDGVDPAGQYSDSGFGVDCCYDSESFDCDFDPDSFHFDVACCPWNMPSGHQLVWLVWVSSWTSYPFS